MGENTNNLKWIKAVKQLRLKRENNDTISRWEVAGVFIATGSEPNSSYLRGILPLDREFLIITNELMETEVPGILAAGDIRHNSARQVITAAGDGAIAALSAGRFLS